MSLNANLQLFRDPARADRLTGIVRGIEKESLRVDPSGRLAQTRHPKALGSALTHPSITTDFSEALLEFITAPSSSPDSVLNQLEEIHRITYQEIGDELLWVNSMPCQLGSDDSIPVGQYGSSNIGTMKSVYRQGLGNRYGRLMQTIAGIHYNFSVPDSLWEDLRDAAGNQQALQDFKSDGYFSLIRNFRRYSWLLLYMLGAAPAVCRSFVSNREHRLTSFGSDHHSLYQPYATSLRMGDLGYQSHAQSSLTVCYNDLPQYTQTLRKALKMPYPDYEKIGLKDSQGNHKQLNAHLLQIENEFYSSIRPKRTASSGETPLQALAERGVEYVEVRCVDLNPLLPCGIDVQTMYFLDTFLLFCLLKDSPKTDSVEYALIPQNIDRTVYQGRDPELKLLVGDSEISLREWGHSLFDEMRPVAELLNSANQTKAYSQVFNVMELKLTDDSTTPAAMLLEEMRANNETYYAMAMRKAAEHRDYFQANPPSVETTAKYKNLAEVSLQRQAEIEASDTLSFDDFLADYYR
ncbi:MAG: glutamate--cysteine ligase [SAR92 bacterium BACL26 MAG-121220-bin70]|uniref:Glutamate--cysteine ligase n=1 Tax=SAR92 bacterium BACL26 MAG-121220-bin70 TaxID=1655626 RepID=A0A0R2UDN0_9GAMM|nr:MAG: glutamate--cysteine ligase [SAR92 bacterium BACL26 MAG-121220-bin70]